MTHLQDFIVSFSLSYAQDAMRRGVLTNPYRFVYMASRLLDAAQDPKELLRLAERSDPPGLTRNQRKDLEQYGACLLRSGQQTQRCTVQPLHRPRTPKAVKKVEKTKRGKQL